MSDISRVKIVISELIREYSKFVDSVESENLKTQYNYYIKCLDMLDNVLMNDFDLNTSDFVYRVLSENYGKYDTRFVGWNGEVLLTIPKDSVSSVEGNFVLVHGTKDELESYRREHGNYPVICNLCLDTGHVKSVETVKDD